MPTIFKGAVPAAMLIVILAAGLPQVRPPDDKAPISFQKPPRPFAYDPGERRDPFKDLFGGQEVQEKKPVGGLADLAIDDVALMGIVKVQGQWEGIIGFSGGFPMSLRPGDQLADGFVLSIEETRVVFRKTHDSNGSRLAKPRDVVREFIAEER